MAESLVLFESVINSRWFLRTSIILFLNKIDVFKMKVSRVRSTFCSSCCILISIKVPLERYFPEYTGGTDVNKAAKYILWRFMQANRARLSVYPQYVINPQPSCNSLWSVLSSAWHKRPIRRTYGWCSPQWRRRYYRMPSRTRVFCSMTEISFFNFHLLDLSCICCAHWFVISSCWYAGTDISSISHLACPSPANHVSVHPTYTISVAILLSHHVFFKRTRP